MQFYAF